MLLFIFFGNYTLLCGYISLLMGWNLRAMYSDIGAWKGRKGIEMKDQSVEYVQN